MTTLDPSIPVPIDHNNPYFLHHGDHPALVLVSDGPNFKDWRASVLTSLSAKNKLPFVIGSLACPAPTDSKYAYWIRCNDMVKSWLLNALSPQIRRSVLHTPHSSANWSQLILRYGKPSITQLFSVQKELNHYVQGTSSISEYFTGLTSLWDEIAGLKEPLICNCGLVCLPNNDSDRVIHFLMGLNESYTATMEFLSISLSHGTANRSILVVEDIDCSMELVNRKAQIAKNPNSKQGKEITLSGLLNFIDGLWSSCGDERIIIFTTNHKERLDPALLRPGRMDVHIHMSYCTPCGFITLALNYLKIAEHKMFAVVEKLLLTAKVTPAEVGEQLMKTEDHEIALRMFLKFLQAEEENNNPKGVSKEKESDE